MGLCTSCGTCVAMCPNHALSMGEDNRTGTLAVSVDSHSCDGCGRCLNVCPGLRVPFGSLAETPDGGTPAQLPLGPIKSAWRGHALDPSVRGMSSSGGAVTALALHAIRTGQADGVTVTRMQAGSPVRPVSSVARSQEDIVAAAGSKYCPVPACLTLEEAVRTDGRYVFVGLPCHIHGLRMAQSVDPRLRERIVLCISLVCHHTPSYRALDFALRSVGVRREDVSELVFRRGAWPGSLHVSLRDGGHRVIPYTSPVYWGYAFRELFVPRRCRYCVDKMSVLSDMSVMDSWSVSRPGDAAWTAMVVCRTERADAFLKSAVDLKAVAMEPVEPSIIAHSQDVSAHFEARLSCLRSAAVMDEPVPSYGLDGYEPGRVRSSRSISNRLLRAMAGREALWPILILCLRARARIGRLARRA